MLPHNVELGSERSEQVLINGIYLEENCFSRNDDLYETITCFLKFIFSLFSKFNFRGRLN